MIPDDLAPPPTVVDGRTVVAAEFTDLSGRVVFDIATRRARVSVTATIAVPTEGYPAFDLRQPIAAASLNGRPLSPERLTHRDLGGGPGAQIRVIDEPLVGTHRLELQYDLGVPDVEDPRPVAWGDGTVDFDVWCSDLYPGRYLEQWFPVGLCQDRFALRLDISIPGATGEHRVLANGAVVPTDDRSWHVAWPDHHTALSSLLLVGPATQFRPATSSSGAVGVELTAAAGIQAEPAELADDVARWLDRYAGRLGSYPHGSRFVAHVWASTRGMEYDGATSASVHSLEHEVFHSWFGRGVKPATANDGWIDEAVTTWVTSDLADHPRLAAVTFPLDEQPVVLAPPSPWSRHTPREAYRTGYRIFAGLAHVAGGADVLLDALARCYQRHTGGYVTTDAMQAELSESLGLDVAPWWDRYVHGRGG